MAMEIVKGPMSLVRVDGTWELDIESKAPQGDMALESYPCMLGMRHKKTGEMRPMVTYPSWSIAMWVLYRIESFFPKGAKIGHVELIRGARRIALGYATLAKWMEIPTIRLSRAAAEHAALYIASEGLKNFSHRIMLGGKITVAYPGGDDSVHLSSGYLYCKQKYDEDGRVKEYLVCYRSH